MSRKNLSLAIFYVIIAVIALFIGKSLFMYKDAINLYQLKNELDPAKKTSVEQLIISKQIFMECAFHIGYFSLMVYGFFLTLFELFYGEPVRKGCNVIIKVMLISSVFRIAIFGLDWIKEIVFIVLVGVITIIGYWIDECNKVEKQKKKRADYIAYGDLFDSRKKTINDVLYKIDNADNNLKGILIKGSWGVGKTSFIEILKEQLLSSYSVNNKYKIIELNAGFSCEPARLICEVESQLSEILSEEYVSFGVNAVIKKYFKNVCAIIDTPSKGIANTLYEILDVNKEALVDAKNDINCLLNHCKTKIIIIIDDLERCPGENIKNIFSVLVNTLMLDNCITVLLTDYDVLTQVEGLNDEYINKYFDESFSIFDSTYKEMAEKYICGENIIDSSISDSNVNKIEEYYSILEHYWNSVDRFICDYFKENKSNDERYQIVCQLKKNIHNPRHFERMWKDVVSYVLSIDDLYHNKKELYLSHVAERDVANTICMIVIMKNYFPIVWDEYLAAGSWFDFTKNHSNQNNSTNKYEFDIYSYSILEDSFIDTLIDLIVFGFNKIIDDESYRSSVDIIKNGDIEIKKIGDYIRLFSSNNTLMINLADFVLKNSSIISIEDKLDFCRAFTSLIGTGISKNMCEMDSLIYRMIWDLNVKNESIYTKYQQILKEKTSEAYNKCMVNVDKAICQLLKNSLERIDCIGEWGYSEFVVEVIPLKRFKVATGVIDDKDVDKFERFMNSILTQDQPALDLRDLNDFIPILVEYLGHHLEHNKQLLIKNEDSIKEYNSIIKHIGRMHKVVCDWLGFEDAQDNIGEKILIEE